jgi:hypothetical protein
MVANPDITHFGVTSGIAAVTRNLRFRRKGLGECLVDLTLVPTEEGEQNMAFLE